LKLRKTDYGTVIFHWLTVIALLAAFVSGLRIATEAPDRTWINLFDMLIPQQRVWTLHMQAAVVLIAVSIAYALYVIRAGLGRRLQMNGIRLRGLRQRGTARWGAINVLLVWIFFLTMLSLIVTGGLMYFGYSAGSDVADLHWYATWILPVFAGTHVLSQYAAGGASQLLRICRPARLVAPPPPLDAVELLKLLVEQTDANEAGSQSVPRGKDADREEAPTGGAATRPQPPGSRRPASGGGHVTVQSNPFVVAVAVAIAIMAIVVSMDRKAVESLHVRRIDSADAPTLDGDTSDPAWRSAKAFSVTTSQGGNFDGSGETKIDIRAVHDGTWAYFLFVWDDPTRSLKRLPLVKADKGWRLLHRGYETGDERDFDEDKFAVLLTTSDGISAGDSTFHSSPHPIPGAPATMTGRGLHYTEDGSYVDVWEWKATSSASGWMDDAHFGPPLEATPAQTGGLAPYRGGFAPDPGRANYAENFSVVDEPGTGANRTIRPLRLPIDPAKTTAALGQIDLDPHHGESEGARWYMTEAESVPYSPDLDRQIPNGAIVPGVVVAGVFSGDRADVRCAARWASGRWALEVARRLDTQSKYDVAIATGVFMRVAAFDHSRIQHTRHVRPIRLEVE